MMYFCTGVDGEQKEVFSPAWVFFCGPHTVCIFKVDIIKATCRVTRPSLSLNPHHSDGASNGTPVATTPIVPNLRTFNLVIATLASGGKWKKALDVSAPMRTGRGGAPAASTTAAGGRGAGGGRGGRGDVANRAVKSVAEGLVADAETYTQLIVACGRGGEADRCVTGRYCWTSKKGTGNRLMLYSRRV